RLCQCPELGVPVEHFMRHNRDALLQGDAVLAGQPQRARRVIHDTRGAIAAMAAQAVAPGDRDLRRLLQAFGWLGADMTYTGSPRAGFADAPGAGEQAGKLNPSLPLEEIAQASAW